MTKMQELMVELAPQMGFITDVEIPRIMAIDRLQQVLVRCNNCRFVCAVQDLAHLEKCIEAGGDWVRDVEIGRASCRERV